MHQHLSSHSPKLNKTTLTMWGIAAVGIIGLFFYIGNINNQRLQGGTTEFGPVTYEHARVVEAIDQATNPGVFTGVTQDIKVEVLKSGEVVTIGIQESTVPDKLHTGQRVIVSATPRVDGSKLYGVVDTYRLPALMLVFLIFVGLLVLFAGLSGVASLIGLAFTIAVLGAFVVPQILAGYNPLMISVAGAFIIAILSLYLSHGFSLRISVALLGTLITITLAIGLAYLFVQLAGLSGTGTEEAFYLGLSGAEGLNLRGLLLGGIVIGTLGVLDDITTAQAAVVEELHKANSKLTVRELYQRGFSVDKEHIISLVNTLALAYVGASLPLLLLFVLSSQPFWVTANSQIVAEEVVRTLVGSSALILAVPITTYLAARIFSKEGSVVG